MSRARVQVCVMNNSWLFIKERKCEWLIECVCLCACMRVCVRILRYSAPHRLPCGCHLASRHQSATLQSPRYCKHGKRGGAGSRGGGVSARWHAEWGWGNGMEGQTQSLKLTSPFHWYHVTSTVWWGEMCSWMWGVMTGHHVWYEVMLCHVS